MKIDTFIENLIRDGIVKSDGIRQISHEYRISKEYACDLWLKIKEKMYAKDK